MVVSKIRFDPEERSVFAEIKMNDGRIIRREWKNLPDEIYMDIVNLHLGIWNILIENTDFIVEGKEMKIYGNFSVVWGFISGVDMVVVRNVG